MHLSELVGEFLEIHEDTSVFARAQELYYQYDPEILHLDIEKGRATYSVPSQSGRATYRVEIYNFHDPSTLYTNCSCPYDLSPVCKHGFAALFDLEERIEDVEMDEESLLIPPPLPNINQVKKIPRQLNFPEPVSIQKLESLSEIDYRSSWEVRNWIYNFRNIHHDGNHLSGELTVGSKKLFPQISLSADNDLNCTCDCKSIHPICKHCYALLLFFVNQNRSHQDALFYLRNHGETIQRLVEEYGFGPDDDWQNNFDVFMQYPRVIVIPKDPGLSKIAPYAGWKSIAERFISPPTEIKETDFQSSKPNYGIIWNCAPESDRIYINLLIGKRKKNGDLGSPLRMITWQSHNRHDLNRDQMTILDLLRRSETMQELYDWSVPSGRNGNFKDEIEELEHHHRKMLEVFPQILMEEHYLAEAVIIRDVVPTRDVKRIFPQSEVPIMKFHFSASGNQYILNPLVEIDGEDIPLAKCEKVSYGFLKINSQLYILDENAARTAFFFAEIAKYRIRKEDLRPFMEELLFPLMDHYEVVFQDVDINIEETKVAPHKKIYLKEVEEHLLLIPILVYQLNEDTSREVYLDGGKRINIQSEDEANVYSILRDDVLELQIKSGLEKLHPKFHHSSQYFYSIPVHQVMRDNWFFKAFDYFKHEGFEIMGLKELKNFKYSPYRPQMRLQASSGTDWFDLQMDVSFGKQVVKLTDIRRAILNNQSYITLGDGTIGILPEEWLKKYSSLFKIAKVEKGSLKLSEFQLNAIDELYEDFENSEVFEAFLEKRERLKNFKQIKKITLPKMLKAKLRNYQKEGYNWLNFLDEFQWGGCLADDMGLGKTVQMLTFLLNISQKNHGVVHLVVVPKSLVFNWINEANKFCPGYKILRHTGTDRTKDSKEFSKYDLVITTYGLVRSDISLFREFHFQYVVLDESQAIKNPTTLTAKAVKLLKAKNRLIMTGTPIENNTFDLYSQMDFINPGMLGSLEGFRREFANPIDKAKDEESAIQLRKLVYPFILSRKKEEVAKELPEKTETIIYCEMPPAQRKVYDHFKDKYRDMLIEKIETEGYNKAGIYILQGLLKLRQICNSPLLLDGDEGQFTSESAKMETLMEMLEDIFSQGNKVLIFSFFKGMLNIISKAFDKQKIGYVTLTGDSNNREELVETFKQEKDKKAFLISLKAGGFGLNLEEANYVFLIDPWWNPAVEQQAIDRTHRIGQTQKVFAYKLICKDTIEEKILSIQNRKKALATEIIHTESGFLKNLKPEDVQDLFS